MTKNFLARHAISFANAQTNAFYGFGWKTSKSRIGWIASKYIMEKMFWVSI